MSFRIVFLEDNPDDVELITHELNEAGLKFKSVRVDTKKEFINVVKEFSPSVILADYSLSTFNGIEAFQMLKDEKINIPFILVTGVLSEQMALQCIRDGIDDFVLKSNFKRLPQAIFNAIEKRKSEREKIRITQELKKSHNELRLLLNRHQISVEEERMIIARDLHDELGQVLTALKIDIMMLWKNISSGKITMKERIDTEFEGIVETVDKITKAVKDISSGLRPETLDELGFVEAIKIHAAEFERRSKIKCKTILPKNDVNLSKDLAIALFRIVQEALTNVARHAAASTAEIKVSSINGRIHLLITDNGKGITDSEINSSQSLGIIGLRERVRLLNGEFQIGPAEEGGTSISVIVPGVK
jgi:signal transduction histidine kinase